MVSIGSLCSGYGGLDLGLIAAVGGEVAFHAELDAAASTILAAHWPDVPNLGDVTALDWSALDPVDWLTAGYPCQPFSQAGQKRGAADVRHLWPDIARGIGLLRPRRVLLENVSEHVIAGLVDVIADLTAIGYDATWSVVRASDLGAPHRRARVFVLAVAAADADRAPGQARRGATPRRPQGGQPRSEPRRSGRVSATDTEGDRRDQGRTEPTRVGRGPNADLGGRVAANAASSGLERRRPQPEGRRPQSRVDVARWGAYAPAIARWERVTGRPAPRATIAVRTGERLSPAFVEWLMGLPAGWVTDLPIRRNAQLRALGNGVIPLQATAAVTHLLDRGAR